MKGLPAKTANPRRLRTSYTVSLDRRQKTKMTAFLPPTNRAMTDNRASSVIPDPCPHFMWSEVGRFLQKGLSAKPRQKPQNALWAFWDICRGNQSLMIPMSNLSQFRNEKFIRTTRPPAGGGLKRTMHHK